MKSAGLPIRFLAARRVQSPAALLLPALILAFGLAACGGKPGAGGPGGPGGPGGGAPPPSPVQIQPVTDVEVQDASEYVATVKSRRSVNVNPQIDGVITQIFVKSGDRVTPGKPILQIDPKKQAATVASQEATRAQKLAALNYAKQDAQRMDTLYKGGAVSKQALDQAQSALAQAQADYDALGAQVE
jgi:multidrug efflux pump subunit AcrA (membrane-fusion protein)